jgi:hypothetical protein
MEGLGGGGWRCAFAVWLHRPASLVSPWNVHLPGGSLGGDVVPRDRFRLSTGAPLQRRPEGKGSARRRARGARNNQCEGDRDRVCMLW